MGGEIVEVDEYRRRFPDDLAEIEHAWKVIRAEYEPDTARGAWVTSPDERPAAEALPATLPALDGRRYFPRNDWSVDSTAGRAAQDTIVMSSELTSVEFHKPGGLGFVCLARDRRLNRSMAMKFIRRRWEKVAAFREQLRLEAEITSRLEHPGVVPVYGVGETSNGRLFYAMRFIQGETLDVAIDRFHQEAAQTAHGGTRHYHAPCCPISWRSARQWPTPTRGVSSTATSNPPTSCSAGTAKPSLVDWGLAIPVGQRRAVQSHEQRNDQIRLRIQVVGFQ